MTNVLEIQNVTKQYKKWTRHSRYLVFPSKKERYFGLLGTKWSWKNHINEMYRFLMQDRSMVKSH